MPALISCLHRVILRILALLCLPSALFAQSHFESYTTDSGLSDNCICAMQQTSDGYLWLTTGDGLLRFDGVHFKVFQSSNTPALKANGFFPSALLEDRQGALWAGTYAGGVIRYYGGAFTAYTTKQGLPSNTVFRVDEDSAGAIWIFTNAGLAQWKQGQLTRVTQQPRSGFDTMHPLGHIAPRNHLGLWRVDASGWERFAYGKWSRLPLSPQVTDPTEVQLNAMVEDSKRRLWYSVSGHEGTYYSASGGHLTTFRGLPRRAVVFYQDRQGYLWLVDEQQQVAQWKNGRSRMIEGARAPIFREMVEDREGGMWLGSCGAGLYHFVPQVITLYRRDGPAEGNDIHALLRDRAGTVWIGTSDGVGRFSNGEFERPLRLGARSSRDNQILALYEDRDGGIWVGTGNGLACYSDGRLRKARGRLAQIHGPVHVIHRDRAGNFWVGGDEGLYRFRDGELTLYTKADGLGGDNVKTILEDRTGTVWVGTEEGLGRIANNKISSWTEANGWSAAEVASMYEDAAGVLWIGSFDKGLSRVENGRLTRVTTAQGLFDDSIFNIQEDDSGFLWMSCRRGIFRVRKRELNDFAAGRISFVTSTHFGKLDGLVYPDCTNEGQPAGFKATDGRLWFRTQNGIGSIDPKLVPVNRNPPPVIVEECVLDGRAVPFLHGLTIRPAQSDLEIHYTAPSLMKSADIRFKYWLQGLDRGWVGAGTRRAAYYSHLPPGTYTFKIIAANGDGVWNTRGSSLAITVLPPFYRTWWFLTMVLLCAAGCIWLAWQSRVARLERANTAQQIFTRQLISSQESERKRIAAELHDSLGQRLVIIKNLALLFLQTFGDNSAKGGASVRQIEEISAEASHAIGEVKEISYNLRPYQLDRIGLTKAVQALARKAGASSPIAFTEETEDIDGFFPQESEINFYRIVQESVNNIVKHSQATRARVSIQRNSERLRLVVQDNGKGFAPGAARQDADSGADSRPGGFGLIGISERAQLLGGSSAIESAPGQGTRITVEINALSRRNGG